MVVSLGMWWVSLQSSNTSKSSPVQPQSKGSQPHHLHPQPSQLSEVEFDSDHLVSATFKVSPMIKPMTNLIHSCFYLFIHQHQSSLL